MKESSYGLICNHSGVSAVIIAIMMLMFLGFAALAVDIGHLYVVKNELKNAADAGALAGARVLYNDLGTSVNTGANQVAHDTATANISEKVFVEVNWTEGNEGDVQRGHWSFASKTFTPNDSLAAPDLWGLTFKDLDKYDSTHPFINAVRVRARRQDKPAASFLAGIFGYTGFALQAESVAYIGFAGTLEPHEVNEPPVLCKDSLIIDGEYSCSIGRFINNSGAVDTSQTGEWSNFSQGDQNSCSGTDPASNSNIRDIIQPQPNVCGNGNVNPIFFGDFMSTTNGELQNAFDKLIYCWQHAQVDTNGDNILDSSIDRNNDGIPDRSWNLTLPVVDCTTGETTCRRVVGAVNVNVVWITDAGTDPHYNNVPLMMDDWTCSTPAPTTEAQRIACWNQFVSHFNLQNADGTPAPYNKKTLYFKPDCTPHIPTGTSSGNNTGILAKIPKLVK